MFTIEDLSKGRCAVINDGTLEELKYVLELAFPDDKSVVAGYIGYKYFSVTNGDRWDCWNNITLPIQSVKDFLHKELTRGDLVWVSDSDPDERNIKVIFLAKIEGAKHPIIAVLNIEEDNFHKGLPFSTEKYRYATKIEEPREVVMTVEDIEKALNIKNLKIVK